MGGAEDVDMRKMEYTHHGDPLVPRQQRFGRYTHSLLEGLGLPIVARYGCRPARDAATGQIAPLVIARDLDTRGWLEGVENFNFHMHLPHYTVTPGSGTTAHVLARQPIDLERPHPLIEVGRVWKDPDAGEAFLRYYKALWNEQTRGV